MFMLLVTICANAQNLVPNGDFETYTTCPTTASQVTLAPPWRQYHVATSDYLNGCAATTVSVPANLFGYQHAASGNAYMGGYAYTSTGFPDSYTEYITAPITPMLIGTTYEVSMSVNRSNNSQSACNCLGILFYDNGPTATLTGTSGTVTSLVPQVSYASYGILADTQNWVRVTQYFTADSAYDNIVIGKFMPGSSMSFTGTGAAYYYYDSVVVKAASGINNLYTDSMICAGDTFVVPYTLNNSALFTS
ncbi:MAG: hypothetical protein JNK00_00140, partial [Flavipsychrobacter sp.]|nr:hypothetical protein [Flavipsychrobacter sp.]